MAEPYSDDFTLPVLEAGVSPLHGYRGPQDEGPPPRIPAGLTIAISREAGSRGATIAKRAGEKLGWDLYTQDMLDYIVQTTAVRNELQEKLPVGQMLVFVGEMLDAHHRRVAISEPEIGAQSFAVVDLAAKTDEEGDDETVEEVTMIDILKKELDGGLYKIWPKEKMEPGEYAVVEYTEGKMNIQVWDFAIKAK